jgi:HEAT repeat protein
VRRAAIHALVELDDPAALDSLIEALKDPDAEVRRQAARAIGDRG